MDNMNQVHHGAGDNVNTKYTYQLSVGMDVGRLIEILQSSENDIKNLFSSMLNDFDMENKIDENAVPIARKNELNGLNGFYDNFIKIHESKLYALDCFFKENDYMEQIEKASSSLRMHIFSHQNRQTDVLEVYIFNQLVQDHSKAVAGNEKRFNYTLTILFVSILLHRK